MAAQSNYTPDFFIIGFPKCGTTSLADALDLVDGICLAKLKEPHYFVPEVDWIPRVDSEDAYRRLFAHAGAGDLTFEASTWYGYSPSAISTILERRSDARFIICVRHPTGLMRSLFVNNLRDGYETHSTAEEAWLGQDDQNAGRLSPHPLLVNYRDRTAVGSHLAAIDAVVPPGQLLIVSQEAMASDPAGELARIAQFLDHPPIAQATLERKNEARTYRSATMRKLDKWQNHSRLGRALLPMARALLPREAIKRALFSTPEKPADDEAGRLKQLLSGHSREQLQVVEQVARRREMYGVSELALRLSK
ncbi:sulfotransferase domain-containing protein [Qipengyuania sphaerica]|uniref:sulfotransferase domain-containing protein n=1 Tax=Qipengyuania sphaerica TaxID=2867243 RepID=UPI001C88709B|nr:sulfotransferase domain-containing protein [Qipengyuania sphaerica]MBX7540898.1 sulfotransferase domain-containing protein [Qipengyuania sphaerica]